jgi:hypothetical protein
MQMKCAFLHTRQHTSRNANISSSDASLNYTAPAPSTMHPERTRETEKLEELMLAPTSN